MTYTAAQARYYTLVAEHANSDQPHVNWPHLSGMSAAEVAHWTQQIVEALEQ